MPRQRQLLSVTTVVCLVVPAAAIAAATWSAVTRRASAHLATPSPAQVRHAADYAAARRRDDFAAMQTFRPGYAFWQHVFTLPDRSIAYGSAVDGRLLAILPAKGNWTREGVWADPALAHILEGQPLARKLGDRRDQVALLLERAAGPVLHNSTRGDALLPNARKYGRFLAEWGAIYERFGVPADIGLAQVILESGLNGTRRSEANAVGFCQWLQRNWKRLNYFSPTVIDGKNQTTQAPYCAAYLSVLATKYGSFIPALSEHNAGGTNVGRTLINGEHLGAQDVRARYFLGSKLARDLRALPGREYEDVYPELRSALVSLCGDGVRQHVQRQKPDRVDAPGADLRDAHAARDFAGRDRQPNASLCGRGAPVQSGARRSGPGAGHALPSVLRQRVWSRRGVLAPAAQPVVCGRSGRLHAPRRRP